MHRIGSSERPDLPLAVVVGAGGLGMATARRLGQTHRVLLADRDEVHVEAQAGELRRDGYDAAALACDVTSADDIARLAEAATAAGPVRGLAYVVGLSPSGGDFAAILSVNLVAATHCAQAFGAIMAPGGCGVFISSSSAHLQPTPDALLPILDDPLRVDLVETMAAALGADASPASAYWLSKAALIRMCQRHAATWGRRGLRIVSLSPGLIATPMGAIEFERSPAKHRLLAATPAGRECTMLEIVDVIDFLVSERASFLSGTDILVDGGMIAALRYPAREG